MSEQGKENQVTEEQQETTTQEPQYDVKIIGAEKEDAVDSSTEKQEDLLKKEAAVDTKTESSKEEAVKEEIEQTSPYDEEFKSKVVSYFKDNGKNIESFDDVLKDPEVLEKIVEKEVNPYADVNFDEDDLQYIKFKKETGRSRKEFDLLNQDINSISPIQLAKQRIEKETGQKFTKEETIEYLEEKFNMDLSNMDGLSAREKIDLQTFVKPIKDEMAAQKETYKQPIEVKTSNKDNDNTVTLENGTIVKKEVFDREVAIRNNYLKQVEGLSNNVGKLSFKFNVDDGGVDKEVDFDYDLSPTDTQEMVSKLSDPDNIIKKHFSNDDGSVDVQSLGIALQFGTKEKLGKLLDTAYQKGRADLAEAQAKVDNNVNFNSQGLPTKKTGEYETKTVPLNELYKS